MAQMLESSESFGAKMFEPGQLPGPTNYLDVEGVVETLFNGGKIGTVRKLFRDNVLHVHKLGGKTGRTQFTEENSARVRIAVCEYLRRKKWTSGDAGSAIAKACGDDDKVVQELIADGRTLDEIYEVIKSDILKSSRKQT